MNIETKAKLYNKLIKSELDKLLYKKLNGINNNDHFALGVMFGLKRDEDKIKMLNLLDEGVKSTDEIILFSSDLFDDYIEKWLSKELEDELSKKLDKKLREINDYDYFVYDVLRFLDTSEKKQKVIDAIDNGLKIPNEIDRYVDSLNEKYS